MRGIIAPWNTDQAADTGQAAETLTLHVTSAPIRDSVRAQANEAFHHEALDRSAQNVHTRDIVNIHDHVRHLIASTARHRLLANLVSLIQRQIIKMIKVMLSL